MPSPACLFLPSPVGRIFLLPPLFSLPSSPLALSSPSPSIPPPVASACIQHFQYLREKLLALSLQKLKCHLSCSRERERACKRLRRICVLSEQRSIRKSLHKWRMVELSMRANCALENQHKQAAFSIFRNAARICRMNSLRGGFSQWKLHIKREGKKVRALEKIIQRTCVRVLRVCVHHWREQLVQLRVNLLENDCKWQTKVWIYCTAVNSQ